MFPTQEKIMMMLVAVITHQITTEYVPCARAAREDTRDEIFYSTDV